ADQHDREPRRDATVARQAVHGVRDLAAQVRGDRLAVDDFCAHGPPPRPFEDDGNVRALPYRADFLQRGGKRRSGAGYSHPLEPRARAGDEADVTHRHAEASGDELYQRSIGLAFARGRAHANLHYAPSIGELRDAVDSVAASPRREPDDDEEAVRLDAP